MCNLPLILYLLVVFELKHYVCDYVIQMAQPNYYDKKLGKTDWAMPLLTHCASHYLGTFVISIVIFSLYMPYYILLAIVLSILDGALHFIIDRFKASPNYLGKYMDSSKYSYWLCTGLDQMLHRFTNFLLIGIICVILSIE